MEGRVDSEETGEFEMNSRRVNDALNLIWTNEPGGGELLGLGLERDVPSGETNLTGLVVQGRIPVAVGQAPIVVRGVDESHPSVPPASVQVGLD